MKRKLHWKLNPHFTIKYEINDTFCEVVVVILCGKNDDIRPLNILLRNDIVITDDDTLLSHTPIPIISNIT